MLGPAVKSAKQHEQAVFGGALRGSSGPKGQSSVFVESEESFLVEAEPGFKTSVLLRMTVVCV